MLFHALTYVCLCIASLGMHLQVGANLTLVLVMVV